MKSRRLSSACRLSRAPKVFLDPLEPRLLLTVMCQIAPYGTDGTITNVGGLFDTGVLAPTHVRLNFDHGAAVLDQTTTGQAYDAISATAQFFTTPVPWLAFGSHTVDVYFPDFSATAVSSSTFTTGADTTGAPKGWVDFITPYFVSGWAYGVNADAAPGAPNNVQIRVDYASSTNGWTTGTPFSPNSYHVVDFATQQTKLGFYYRLPETDVTGVQVWAIDGDTNAARVLEYRSLYYSTPTLAMPVGYIDTHLTSPAGDGTTYASGFDGWAFDPLSPNQPATVSVYVSGELFATVLADQNRPDLTPWLGAPNHGFHLANLPRFMGNYARNIELRVEPVTPTGVWTTLTQLTSQSSGTVPTGGLDFLTTYAATGWTDLGGAQTKVRTVIDGVTGAWTDANLDRPDLAPGLANTHRGYQILLPALTAGAHTVAVEIDSGTTVPFLLRQQTLTVGNQKIIAYLDQSDWRHVHGWVIAPDNPAAALDAWVSVDSTVYSTTPQISALGGKVVTFTPRPDTTALFGTPAWGFDLDVSPLISPLAAPYWSTIFTYGASLFVRPAGTGDYTFAASRELPALPLAPQVPYHPAQIIYADATHVVGYYEDWNWTVRTPDISPLEGDIYVTGLLTPLHVIADKPRPADNLYPNGAGYGLDNCYFDLAWNLPALPVGAHSVIFVGDGVRRDSLSFTT